MNVLYCDCFSGISGDMFLGALLDMGLPVEVLDEQFRRLNLDEYQGVSAQRVLKGAITATQLHLDFSSTPAEHHHHAIEPQHHHPHSGHRHPADINHLIEASSLPARVQETSLKIFARLAEAEAKVHGVPLEEVHFHEVGAVDSILDIIGAAVGLDYFAIEGVYASALPLGSGRVHTQHGWLPLPAPATLELLRMAQAPVVASNATQELITPTGAALLAALATFSQPEMSIERVGIGAGQRELEWPNILRLWSGILRSPAAEYVEIETNIDDMNPQIYGYVMSKLFEAGALDVFFTPIYMKKNRPATRLSVIARQAQETALSEILLRETSTLGVRIQSLRRREAQREMRTVQTPFGEVPLKVKRLDGEILQAAPEYEACVQLAKSSEATLAQVMQAATAAGLIWIEQQRT